MLSLDPVRLAKRQIEIDHERTSRFPHLLSHKAARMAASPLAMLRGSAPLFYEILEAHPVLCEGPAGEGWLVGDAHIENFGAYRPGALSTAESEARVPPERVVFDLNDFDDAFLGPWRLDVLRLLVSLILVGREAGADGANSLALADELLAGYVTAAFHGRRARTAPRCVVSLVERVRRRTRKDLLDARTEVFADGRRFVRGPRYQSLPRKLRAKVDPAFARYAAGLPRGRRPPERAIRVLDAAFRVAGTGSLGCLRVAVLVRGKGRVNGAWIFDLKEEAVPSSACLVRPPRMAPAARVLAAMRACLPDPPMMAGTTELRGRSMLVRRLSPQEDKLDLTALAAADLPPLARWLGALLGAAHRRGATKIPGRPWSEKEQRRLRQRAVALAGLHEAAYLAYCDLVRGR